MKKWLSVLLGIITAIGGFLDAGTISTSGESGAKFKFGLVWAILLATTAVIMLVEMAGRFTAVSKKTYAEAVREVFGFKFYMVLLLSEIISESMLLAAELGGLAIAMSLFTGLSWHILFPVAALLVWVMCWRGSFDLIENAPSLLGLLTLSFLVGIFALGGPPSDALPTLWSPEIKSGELAGYLYLAAATLGATISPYLLYFYSSGAREEKWDKDSLGVNRVTALVGMGFGSIGSLALLTLSVIVLQPMNISASTLGEIGLTMAKPFGKVGSWLFAAVLFATCLGSALEVLLSVGYTVAQGFGWEWGQDKKPAEAPRYKITLTLFLVIAFGVGLLGSDPLQLALLASTVIALFLPISLLPFLFLMNNKRYLGDKTNRRFSNIAVVIILVIAFGVAVVSPPLEILSGGGG